MENGSVAVQKLTPERRRQLTRDALLDAALEVFVRRGFSGASLDEIAETAGFTRGAIYKHFENKDDLLLAVYDRVNERTLATFAEVLEDASSIFDAKFLASVWERLIGNPDLLMLEQEFTLYVLRNPSARERSLAQRERSLELVAAFIEDSAAAAGVRLKLPARTMAGIYLSTSLGFAQNSQFDEGQTGLYEQFLEIMIPATFEQVDEPG
jgi:AcrR family transcriptional regulator